MTRPIHKPLRLLVVCPSWVGDVIMATPALGAIRAALPGAFIGGLMRPGMDVVVAGSGYFDECHVDRASGVFGPKHVAAKVRPRRYDTALLLTNSFSTALVVRLAGIPRRVGYERDCRGILLTDVLHAPKTPKGDWAPVPAISYYWHAAMHLLGEAVPPYPTTALPLGPDGLPRLMSLTVTPEERARAAAVLARAGLQPGEAYAVLNPGGNNEAKRWPADRFGQLAAHLAKAHGLRCVVNGSPDERGVVNAVVEAARGAGVGTGAGGDCCVSLTEAGVDLGSLKAIIAGGALMVTNDTGPRHIAAALGVPTVTLFGPTDARWTVIPTRPRAPEVEVLADPTLPPGEVANDHPERCAIDRISLDRAIEATEKALAASGRGQAHPAPAPGL